MSTWMSDLKKTDPRLAEAYAIVGNQSDYFLRQMVKALKRCSLLNTPEDTKRLKAAQYILRHKK